MPPRPDIGGSPLAARRPGRRCRSEGRNGLTPAPREARRRHADVVRRSDSQSYVVSSSRPGATCPPCFSGGGSAARRRRRGHEGTGCERRGIIRWANARYSEIAILNPRHRPDIWRHVRCPGVRLRADVAAFSPGAGSRHMAWRPAGRRTEPAVAPARLVPDERPSVRLRRADDEPNHENNRQHYHQPKRECQRAHARQPNTRRRRTRKHRPISEPGAHDFVLLGATALTRSSGC